MFKKITITSVILISVSLIFPALGSQSKYPERPATNQHVSPKRDADQFVSPKRDSDKKAGSKLDVVTRNQQIQKIITGYLFGDENYIFQDKLESPQQIDLVAIAPDGQTIAAHRNSEYRRDICVWKVKTSKLLYKNIVSRELKDMVYSPDGKYIVICKAGDKCTLLQFFNARSGSEFNTDIAYAYKLAATHSHRDIAAPCVFSSDGKKIIAPVYKNQKAIVSIDLVDGSIDQLIACPADTLCAAIAVENRRDNTRLLLGGKNYIQRINVANSGSLNNSAHTSAGFSNDLDELFAYHDPTKRITKTAYKCTLSPDGTLFAVAILFVEPGTKQTKIVVGNFAPDSTREVTVIETPGVYEVDQLVFSPDNSYLLSTGKYTQNFWDSEKRLYRYNLDAELEELNPYKLPAPVSHITFSQDGAYLALTVTDHTINIFRSVKDMLKVE